ncbi:MAG: GNAT family N-acetyltransferase, partial [Flavobacteriales bacterium]
QHLITLVRRCFGTHLSLDQVGAKFNTAPFGAADIGYLAFAATGEPAAYYGVFPVLVNLKGQVHLAAQSGDTMTDPDHQKKGLFIRLAKLTYALAQENGVRFVFGFPNENSLPGFERKLNWTLSGHLYDLRFRTGALPLCELASKSRLFKPVYAAIIRRRASRVISAPLATETQTDACVHDERFHGYKQAMGALWIEVAGVRMFVKPAVHLYVGDIRFKGAPDADLVLRAITRAAGIFYCSQAVCTFSEGHPLFTLLSTITVPERSLPIGHLDLGSGLPIGDLSFSRADLDTF